MRRRRQQQRDRGRRRWRWQRYRLVLLRVRWQVVGQRRLLLIVQVEIVRIVIHGQVGWPLAIHHKPIIHSANLVVDNDLLRISGQTRVHCRTHRARTDAPRPHLTPCNAYKQTANPLSGRPTMYVVCRLLIKGDLRPRSHSAK